MKNQIKIIEDATQKILANGTDLIKVTDEFNNFLAKLSLDYDTLTENKVKLINYIFKYPKRKILFVYNYEGNNYSIGVNENGLGVILRHTHNITNITDYWGLDYFERFLKNSDFQTEFLKHTKAKFKPIILNLFQKEIPKYDKTLPLSKIKIRIKENYIQFCNLDTESQYDTISLLSNNEDIRDYRKEDFLYGFAKNKIDISIQKIQEFAYLIQYKDEIIKALNKEFFNLEQIRINLDAKIKNIELYLNPFIALQQI